MSTETIFTLWILLDIILVWISLQRALTGCRTWGNTGLLVVSSAMLVGDIMYRVILHVQFNVNLIQH